MGKSLIFLETHTTSVPEDRIVPRGLLLEAKPAAHLYVKTVQELKIYD